MKKYIVLVLVSMALIGCSKDSGYYGKGGTKMRDGDPERGINQHSQHVVRNEAAAAAAVGAAAQQLGVK